MARGVKPPPPPAPEGWKWCRAGEHWVEADLRFFVHKKDSKDKLHPYCRECAARRFREKYYPAADKAVWKARRKADKLRRKLPSYAYNEPMPKVEAMPELDPKLFGDEAWPEDFVDTIDDPNDDS